MRTIHTIAQGTRNALVVVTPVTALLSDPGAAGFSPNRGPERRR